MASLGAAVTAETAVFEVSAVETVAEYPKRYTIEDEVVYVTGGGGTTSLSVQRGADDTTAVAHAAGTALTAAPVGSGGGGAVSVDNGTDPPAEVTTIVAPGAVVDGGEATLGKWTLAPAADADADLSRTATATGIGDAVAHTTASSTDGDAEANTTVTVTGVQDANAKTTATTVGGNADATIVASVTGADGGDAFANVQVDSVDGSAQADRSVNSTTWRATADTFVRGANLGRANTTASGRAATDDAGGNATIAQLALTDGSGVARTSLTAEWDLAGNPTNIAGISVEADSTSARIGFFTATPVARPTGVAVTAEAIHAALVSLGLISA